MKYMIVILLLSIVAVPLTAQDQTSLFDSANGRYWKGLTPNERLSLLVGIYVGANFMVAGTPCEKRADMLRTGLTAAEIQESVNRFYSEPVNGPLIIIDAILYTKLKAEGASPQMLEGYLSRLRQGHANQKQ